MTNWQECKRISELPEVDEALLLFAEGETTEDQAVAIVQAILDAAPKPAQAAADARDVWQLLTKIRQQDFLCDSLQAEIDAALATHQQGGR